VVLVTTATGVYKPTYNWGPHIVDELHLKTGELISCCWFTVSNLMGKATAFCLELKCLTGDEIRYYTSIIADNPAFSSRLPLFPGKKHNSKMDYLAQGIQISLHWMLL
jgi:hypothetical protein